MDELSIVSNPILSIEMLIIRLVHLKDIPDYESLVNSIENKNLNDTNPDNNQMIQIKDKKIFINDEDSINKISKDQIKNTIQTKPSLSTETQANLIRSEIKEKVLSFEDLIQLASKKREIQLKYDLEKNVNLIKFLEGKIDISFNQNLDRKCDDRLLEYEKRDRRNS